MLRVVKPRRLVVPAMGVSDLPTPDHSETRQDSNLCHLVRYAPQFTTIQVDTTELAPQFVFHEDTIILHAEFKPHTCWNPQAIPTLTVNT